MLMRVSAILPSGLGTSSISVCSGISSRGMSCGHNSRQPAILIPSAQDRSNMYTEYKSNRDGNRPSSA